jgi:hypothetical protein
VPLYILSVISYEFMRWLYGRCFWFFNYKF